MRRYTLAIGSLALATIGLMFGIVPGSSSSSGATDQDLPHRAYLPVVARDAEPPPAPPQTPTLAPTVVPAPSPTQPPPSAPAGLSVQGGLWWVDSLGYNHVTGIVVNYFSFPVDFVEVTARFYGTGGQMLATDSSFTRPRAILSGESSPFDLLLFDKVPGIVDVELEVTDYDTDIYSAIPSGLSVAVTNQTVDIIGYGHVYGTVTNSSSSSWDFVEIIIAIVKDGRVLAVDSSFAKPRLLTPGKLGSFEVLVSPHTTFDPVDFTGVSIFVWVDADVP